MTGTEPENPTEKDLSDIENVSDAPEPSEVPQLYDIPLDELLSDQVSTFTPEETKKIKLYGIGALVAILLLILLGVYGCQPKKGSVAYGICSTFLEMNTPYPNTLNYIDLEGSKTAVRIYYTVTDPFGQFKQETIECKFGSDGSGGMKLTEILRNRRPVDADTVKKFNDTLPIIINSEPYIVIPPAWKNQLVPD